MAQSIITSVLAENAKKQNATLSKQKHLVKRVLEENLEKMLEAERKYDVSKHRSVIAEMAYMNPMPALKRSFIYLNNVETYTMQLKVWLHR